MNTLILNGLSSTPFILNNYNRNTSFDRENHSMNSVAYFDIVNENNAVSNLQNIGQSGITHILIKHDDEPIYVLANLNANINSISEALADDRVVINVSVVF